MSLVGTAVSCHLRHGLLAGCLLAASLAPLAGQQVTVYPVPANAGGVAGGNAWVITTGPDGALWFGGNNHVGRITTAGVIAQYTLPTGNIAIKDITSGPDGALWF